MKTNVSERDAILSPCRLYRFALWRRWDLEGDTAMFIGLNPSMADESQDDPTIRRCVAFAKAWGYAGLCMTNLFAYRATDPGDMIDSARAGIDIIGKDNDHWLRHCAERAGVVVAGWGAQAAWAMPGRVAAVRSMMPRLHYLRLTKDGHPGHPLYLPASLRPVEWLAKV